MNKKLIGVICAAVLATGVGAGGFIWYKSTNHPLYGKYIASSFNGAASYAVLEDDKITFNNIDFETAESDYAKALAMDRYISSKANEENTHDHENEDHDHEQEDEAEMKERSKIFKESINSILSEVDFDKTFNGRKFSLNPIEEGKGYYSYQVVDDKNDYVIMVTVDNNEKAMSIGRNMLKYEK